MSDVTAASFPIVLNGKTYDMVPLSDRDIEELNNWLRSSFITMARSALNDDMSQRERDEIISSALREARKLSWMEGYGAELMASGIEGMSRVIYQSLMKHHRGRITHDEVTKALLDPATLEQSQLVWKELNLTPAQQESAAPAPGAKKKSRPRKKRSTRR